MRVPFTIIAAIILLFYSGRDCHAQSWTRAGQQVVALQTAFNTAPKVVPLQRGSEPYYDVVIKNLCDGPVSITSRAWLHELASKIKNRLILINAQVAFPDSPRNRLEVAIFSDGNFSSAQSICNETVVQGIPRTEKVQVTLKLIVANELTQAAADVIAGGLAALAAAKVNPWLGIAVGVVAGGAKAYAAQTKEVTQQALAAGGNIISTHTVMINGPATKNIRPISPTIAEAHFITGGQDWLSLHRKPRPQLLQYNPYTDDIRQIIEQIDLVTLDATWDQMVQAAHFETAWSHPSRLTISCASLRNQLQHSLRWDSLAVKLALYAQFKLNRDQFVVDRDRLDRGCLERGELIDLRASGHILATMF